MSFVSQQNEIRTRFNAQIGSTPVAWPNVTYTPTIGTSWVRFQVLDGETEQVDFGASTKSFRSMGIISVQVFAPDNTGETAALTIADTVAGIFRNWCGATVRCRAASIKDIGPDGNGWYQVNVSAPFQRDEQF
jgi:hypothetical protein